MKTAYLSKSILSLLATTLLVTTASSKIVREVDETIDLDGIETVDIQISGGNITIAGSDRSDLQFNLDMVFKSDSESEAEEMEKDVTRVVKKQGDTLVIKVEYDRSFWESAVSRHRGVHFDASLELPSELAANAHTNGGNVDVSNQNNKVKVSTNGGNIRINDTKGELNAHTNGGNIVVSGQFGPADLRTNGGNISILATNASIDAHTNGGNIDAVFSDGLTDRSKLTTNRGNITASLPQDYAFDLKAVSPTDGVRYNYDGALKGEIKNKKIDAAVNGGGPLLSLKTYGGQIEITNL